MSVTMVLRTAPVSLSQAEAQAALIEDLAAVEPLAVTIAESGEDSGLWETIAYFHDAEEAQKAAAASGLTDVVLEALPDCDWVRQSLTGLHPVQAGRFFLHGSHDRARARSKGLALEIDAGTAFGTGHHGTTEGCLNLLGELARRKKPNHILDLGCGTGVLGIAAAKLFRTPVLATDIDPEAVRVTRANARRNGVAPLLHSAAASGLNSPLIARYAPYDLILANILARPLIALAQGLSQLLAPQGTLILSGLTLDQTRWVAAAYGNRGLRLTRRQAIAPWVSLSFMNPQKKSA